MQLTLYTKPDCSLCLQLKDDLAALQREIPLEIIEIDIEADTTIDTELRRRFAYLVPVLELPGQELRYPPHDYLSLRSALMAAAQAYDNKPTQR
jgi:glutaredoxin